ncbi:MAG: hypothetical protein ABIZ91_15050, partial [Gemmatimonadaceae bacterium]
MDVRVFGTAARVGGLREWRGGRGLMVAAAFVSVLTGCFRYTPVPLAQLSSGTPVRVELTAVAVDRLRAGPDSVARLVDGFRVRGDVSRLTTDSLMLSVPVSYMEANVRHRTRLYDLPLYRTDVRSAAVRKLDRKRTTWVALGFGAATVAAVAFVL